MTPETTKILKKIVYRFWDDTLNNDSAVNPGFNKIYNNATSPIRRLAPQDGFDEWYKAMHLLSSYGVFSLETEEGLDEFGLPSGELYYRIINFDLARLIEFCTKFQIELHKDKKFHTASLTIGNDRTPVVKIDDNTYHCEQLHPSTLTRLLQLALHYSPKMLTVGMINAVGSKDVIVKGVLGGKKLNLAKSTKIRYDYFRRNKTFPRALEVFFEITDGYIVGKKTIQLDDAGTEKLIKVLA